MISVTCEVCEDREDDRSCSLKIQNDMFEINIWLTLSEIKAFPQVKTARWESRGALKLGESAGAPVFWSSDRNSLSILVGADNETWDFGVALPIATLDQIITEIGETVVGENR